MRSIASRDVRRLAAVTSATLVVAGSVWACSGTTTVGPGPDGGAPPDTGAPPPDGGTMKGGAFFQLSGGVDPEAPGKALSCPDAGRIVTISSKDCDSGTCAERLLSDGQDGATVTCGKSGSNFSAQVGNAAGYMAVKGTMVPDGASGDRISTDAYVSVGWSATGYRVRNTRCTIKFPAANNTSDKLFGRVTCPKVENTATSGAACSMSEINGVFFNFSGCLP